MNKRWKISFNSPVILGFVGICFLVMLVSILTGGRSNDLLFVTWHSSLRDPLTMCGFPLWGRVHPPLESRSWSFSERHNLSISGSLSVPVNLKSQKAVGSAALLPRYSFSDSATNPTSWRPITPPMICPRLEMFIDAP